jgi:integrase/recombinase XerD
MTSLAPLLERFFTERLIQQCQASPHTIAAYRDTFRLLLRFCERQLKKAPSELLLAELDAPLIGSFLDYLETERDNSARARNARLAAIHSFFRYGMFLEPSHAGLIQRVLAIPQKRFQRNLVSFLTDRESQALLAAPNQSEWIGRRDHMLILFGIHTGLRVSELVALGKEQIELGRAPHVRCHGKGRKERCTPIPRQCAKALRAWLAELGDSKENFVFPSRHGGKLSRDAVEHLLRKYAAIAEKTCPSLKRKVVSPHVLRHTSAMRLLQADVDRSTIALWLGHESIETTEIYLHADLSMKEKAIAKTAPLSCNSRRFKPSDRLLAFLAEL